MEVLYCRYCGSLLKDFVDGDGRVRKRCRNCGAVFYENPVPATALIIPAIDDRERILLVRRAVEPCRGKYSLPGGFIEIDETPEEGAIREMQEETGFDGKVKKLLGVANQSSPQYKMVLLVGYEMNIVGGALAPSDDAEDAQFFPLDDHPEIAFEGHRYFVDIYRREIEK